jgi:predicted nucleic acid-binding protein
MIVLDTSILVSIECKEEKVIKKILEISERYGRIFYITFMNLFEFLLGLKIRGIKKRKEAISFLERFSVLNSTEATSKIMAELKFKYDKKGEVISLADLIIASIVIEKGMILVTSDKDFEKIEELRKIII